MSEKRNTKAETAQPDLFGAPPPGPGAHQRGEVGARQAAPEPPLGGGEYLEMCGTQNFCSDPRFNDLRTIGLPKAWLVVAETVGFDAFLEVWRRLSSMEFSEWVRRDTGGTRMPMLRSFDSYLRFQRNRYIEALGNRGMSVAQVARAVARNLREPLDEKHVAKIITAARVERCKTKKQPSSTPE